MERITLKMDAFYVFAILVMAFVGRMQYAPTLTAEKDGAFGDSYTYLAYFPGLGRGLDFLLPSFLSSRKGKKVGAYCIRPQNVPSMERIT